MVHILMVFIVNGGKTEVNLLVKEFTILKPLVFLGFTAAGVLIGVLLK